MGGLPTLTPESLRGFVVGDFNDDDDELERNWFMVAADFTDDEDDVDRNWLFFAADFNDDDDDVELNCFSMASSSFTCSSMVGSLSCDPELFTPFLEASDIARSRVNCFSLTNASAVSARSCFPNRS